jgi:hypothetical protein
MLDKELAQFNPLFSPIFFLSLFSLTTSGHITGQEENWQTKTQSGMLVLLSEKGRRERKQIHEVSLNPLGSRYEENRKGLSFSKT